MTTKRRARTIASSTARSPKRDARRASNDSSPPEGERGSPPTFRLLAPSRRPCYRDYNAPDRSHETPDATAERRRRTDVGSHGTELRRASPPSSRRRSDWIRRPTPDDVTRLNLQRVLCWSHSFPLQRFHVLFNSLFKVLFIFPSRYFFAIGLVLVFSFRWSLPPALGCNPKQPDSSKVLRGAPFPIAHGILTLRDVPFQATWTEKDALKTLLQTTIRRRCRRRFSA